MNDAARNRVIGELQLASLRAGHAMRIRVNGTSMLPSIWPGDVVTVTPPAAFRRPGEVILTSDSDRLRVHRLIEHWYANGSEMIVTRGDALAAADPAVTSSAVLGVVVARNGRPVKAPGWGTSRALILATNLFARWTPTLALLLRLRAASRRFWRVAS